MIRYKPTAERHFGFLHNTGVWMVVVMALITLHVIEVAWWGLYYRLQGYFADYLTALLLLGGQPYRYGVRRRAAPARLRLIGGVEALTGWQMIGWSIAIMVRLAAWTYDRWISKSREILSRR